MKVWLPYVQCDSGVDVFTETLAQALNSKGVDARISRFPHQFQYAPWLLSRRKAPASTDIVLANSWNAFVFRRPGTRLVAIEHLMVLDPMLAPFRSFAQGMFHNTFVRFFERGTLREADQIIAVSRFTGDSYSAALGALPKVILNGIDTDFFTPGTSTEAGPKDRPFRLLFVGNISRRKGADMLPKIMRLLGSGYELSYTVGRRTDVPFPPSSDVRRLGRLDHHAVRDEYRRADVLLFPTRLEGLPLVAMEAMACGTPVVASDIASLPEVIQHSRTGMLCEPNDCLAFAQAIRHLRENSAVLNTMRLRATGDARQRFSLGRMTDDYIALFESLLGRKNA